MDHRYLYRESALELEPSGPDCERCGDEGCDVCGHQASNPIRRIDITEGAWNKLQRMAWNLNLDPGELLSVIIHRAELEQNSNGFLVKLRR